MKNDEYLLISGWMINELHLKGNDLLVYALIHRYSQDSTHRFYGSLQYIADWTNSTVSGVQNNLKNLLNAGLICKEKVVTGTNGVRNEYWISKVPQSCTQVQQSCIQVPQSCTQVPLSGTNNRNIKEDNNIISKDIKESVEEIIDSDTFLAKHKNSRSFKVLQSWITLAIEDVDVREAFLTWLSTMYQNKKIANLSNLRAKIEYLRSLNLTKEEQIAVIEDATDKIWFTFQYSVDILKKRNYIKNHNIQGTIPQRRDINNLDLSSEVY